MGCGLLEPDSDVGAVPLARGPAKPDSDERSYPGRVGLRTGSQILQGVGQKQRAAIAQWPWLNVLARASSMRP